MYNSQNKKTLQIVLIVVIAIITLSIGYAAISAINLTINGNATASVNQNNFQVYFVNTADTPSLTGNVEVTGSAAIDNQDSTIATFNVGGLTKVGDYAIATYTILNNSNAIGAELSLNVTNTNDDYFRVTETVTDTQLQAGDTTTATVKVEMIKTPIIDSVTTSVTARLTATPLENAQATGNNPASKIAGDPESFATDSWATIQKAVRNNNTSAYNVGDTKTVSINNTNYTVRLVNKTTGEHCGDNDTAYSQTACGFVVEFVDVIERRSINSANTNVGGYPASEIHTYLQVTFYNSLPSELRSAIKPTRVISGYGNNGTDSANFTSTDTLYLLSGAEIQGADKYDTAAGTTHQLDYYVNMPLEVYDPCGGCGVTANRYPRAIKKYQESNYNYCLRSADSSGSFRGVNEYGDLYSRDAYSPTNGLSPAFRIG